MAKIYDKDINKHVDWNGDESTENLPVSGRAIQKFIRGTLQSKIGYVHVDELHNMSYGFADEEDFNLWSSDPEEYSDLVINSWYSYCPVRPTLEVEGESYKNIKLGDPITFSVKFITTMQGTRTITVRDDKQVIVKTIKTSEDTIPVSLGNATTEGTFKYTVSGVLTSMDGMTYAAENTLEYTIVVGGVKLSCDFAEVLNRGINTSTSIDTNYSASVSDTSKTIKVKGRIYDEDGHEYGVQLDNQGTNPINSISSAKWNIGTIEQWGKYTLKLWAYTGNTPETSDDTVSLEYTFNLLNSDDFMLSCDLQEVTINTNNTLTIPYIIEAGNSSQKTAHGRLYKVIYSGGAWIEDGNDIQTLNKVVNVNVTNYWTLSKIAEIGDYCVEMWATSGDDTPSPEDHDHVLIYVHVEAYVPETDIERDGLLAEFTAKGHSNDNPDDTLGVWLNEVTSNPNYKCNLYNLNYSTNGWVNVDGTSEESEEKEKMLKFTGESYGIFMNGNSEWNPMKELTSSEVKGFTAEVIFRTRCIGELKSKVITAHRGFGTDSVGFSASYDNVSVGSSKEQINYDVTENEWIHATLVIDKEVHTDVQDVQDYAPSPLMTVYINGSMCASSIVSDPSSAFNNFSDKVLLNSAFNTATNNIDFFGSCEIKAIRFYNKALPASKVYHNYVNSIFDKDERDRIAGRNEDVLPIVYLVNINNEWPRTQKEEDDDIQLVNFSDLNNIKEKSFQKKQYVHSRFYYKDSDVSVPEEKGLCVVQTQGTSSLQYPVKNYKIILYENETMAKKKKIEMQEGWQPESKYTLKCDYMEAAHLNNTPSCIFYNDLIDTLVENNTINNGWTGVPFEVGSTYDYTKDERTPARRGEHKNGEQITYFDAIKGFPCVVKYYESEEEYNSDRENNGTYVGTYMFNIDKSGDNLGFKVPAKCDSNGIDSLLIDNPRVDITNWNEYNSSNTYNKGANVIYDDLGYEAKENGITGEWDGSKWNLVSKVTNTMQSFEGKANKSNSAGCFYSFDDYKATAYHDDYCESAYKLFIAQRPSSELDLDEFITEYAGSDQPYAVDAQDNPLYLLTEEAFYDDPSNIPYANEYDYFAADYESRYDWDDLEKGGAEFWGDSTWGLKRIINWVSANAASAGTGSTDTFRSDFSNYFDLKYCLIYYLQMVLFGQVDNAGKNAMWDTWDGKIWRPRPYDLDTATGLDNSGFEIIGADAEMIEELSPKKDITPGTGSFPRGVYPNQSANKDARYFTYNTRTSKFWIAFAKSYASEIKRLYSTLRTSGIYTIENISNVYIGNTSDIIGEVYYNRDMATKFYKLSDIGEYISRMHGNRVQKFKSWMTKRLIFCDTLFEYSDSDSLNKVIDLRSDVNQTVYVSIQTYSPQYIKVDVGSGQDATLVGYCSPDSLYEDPNTFELKEGVLFQLPVTGNNKEVKIYGAGNIKNIDLRSLVASNLQLGEAVKLTDLNVSGSNRLSVLSVTNNPYLQSINCSNCVNLGTDSAGGSLDISNCVNLKYLNVDNTKLTSIVFPVGGSLKQVSARNTKITGIDIDSCYFLNNIDVSGCNNINTYKVVNCNSIQNINVEGLPITTFTVQKCANLQNVSLAECSDITTLNSISECPSLAVLSFQNNNSPVLSTLDLTYVGNLTHLDVSGSQTINKLILSPNVGNSLVSLKLNSSTIQYLGYDNSASYIDLSNLTHLTELFIDSCNNIERIHGIHYTGPCSRLIGDWRIGLFGNCENLTSFTGDSSITIANSGDATRLFYNCEKLSQFGSLVFNFAACSTLYQAFMHCYALPFTQIKTILDSCGTALTSIGGLCYEKYSSSYRSDGFKTLPQNFFGNLKNVTNASAAFYNAGIRTLNENAFVDSNGNSGLISLKEAGSMFSLSGPTNDGLQSIPNNIFSYMPNVENIRFMFATSRDLTNTLPSNFFSYCTKVKRADGIFHTSGITVDLTDTPDLLKSMPNLENAAWLFATCANVSGIVPIGFFASLPKLITISSAFSDTSVTLPSGSILQESGSNTVITTLKRAGGLFKNCINVTSVPNDLLTGGDNIESIGSNSEETQGQPMQTGGIFEGCTGLSALGSSFFSNLPNLTNISYAFKDCSNLNTISGTMFNSNSKLEIITSLFENSAVSISNMTNMFASSKNTITHANNLFKDCVNITNFNSDIVSNMPKLIDLSAAFKGCNKMFVSGVSGILAGDVRLARTKEMFSGCKGFDGTVDCNLFDDCRNTIEDVSYMFYDCYNDDSNSGVIGISTGNEDQPTIAQYGLLANCTKLRDTRSMFENCKYLNGSIPWDLFWTNGEKYINLTNIERMFYNCSFDEPYSKDGIDYLINPNFFANLSKVTNASYMFGKSWYQAEHMPSWSNSYKLDSSTFDGMYSLTNIRGMFKNCLGLGDSIDSGIFKDSLTSITDAGELFARTKITQIDELFLRLNSTYKNTSLRKVDYMLYDCQEIDSNTNIPDMQNSQIYKIDTSNNGHLHYCYNVPCNNISDFLEPWKSVDVNYD